MKSNNVLILKEFPRPKKNTSVLTNETFLKRSNNTNVVAVDFVNKKRFINNVLIKNTIQDNKDLNFIQKRLSELNTKVWHSLKTTDDEILAKYFTRKRK